MYDTLERPPSCAAAPPGTPLSVENEKVESSCQHSSVELPLRAPIAVKLGLSGAAMEPSNKLETVPKILLLYIMLCDVAVAYE